MQDGKLYDLVLAFLRRQAQLSPLRLERSKSPKRVICCEDPKGLSQEEREMMARLQKALHWSECELSSFEEAFKQDWDFAIAMGSCSGQLRARSLAVSAEPSVLLRKPLEKQKLWKQIQPWALSAN